MSDESLLLPVLCTKLEDMSSSGGGGKAEQPVVEAYSVEETTKSTTTAVEATPLTSSAENRKIVRYITVSNSLSSIHPTKYGLLNSIYLTQLFLGNGLMDSVMFVMWTKNITTSFVHIAVLAHFLSLVS